MDRVTFTRRDQSHEATRTMFNIVDMTAANFDTVIADIDTLGSALDGLAQAAERSRAVTASTHIVGAAAAGDREAKWLIRLQDAVNGKLFSYELGTADPSVAVLNVGGRTIVDPTAAEWAALAGALATGTVKSPYGNAMQLIEIEKVGRNI